MEGSLKRLWCDLFDEAFDPEEGLSERRAKLNRTEKRETSNTDQEILVCHQEQIQPANTQLSALAAPVPGLHLIKGFLSQAQQVGNTHVRFLPVLYGGLKTR